MMVTKKIVIQEDDGAIQEDDGDVLLVAIPVISS